MNEDNMPVPQINLDHIIALERVKAAASGLKDQAREEYRTRIKERVKESIRRVRGWRLLPSPRGLLFWRKYYILPKSFFRVKGKYWHISNKELKSLSCPQEVSDAKDLLSNASLAKKLEEIGNITSGLLNYLDQGENFVKPSETDDPVEEQLTLSMGDEGPINDYVDRLFDAVRDYNSGLEELVPKLPGFEAQEGRADLRAEATKINSYLHHLGIKQYTSAIIDDVAELSKAVSALHTAYSSLVDALDFSTISPWRSENFGELAGSLGFRLVRERGYSSPYHPRVRYAFREVHSTK